MNISILILGALVGLALAINGDNWENHKKKFRLSFKNNLENDYRKTIWSKNIKLIDEHNKEFANGLQTYQMSSNKFTHLNYTEFISQYTGHNVGNGRRLNEIKGKAGKTTKPVVTATPASVDWRGSIMVGPIKDQGNCGSCWAFSAIAALEGQQSKKSGTYINLSDQQITSCSVSNWGCNGGDPEYAYMDLLKTATKGVNTLAGYPVKHYFI